MQFASKKACLWIESATLICKDYEGELLPSDHTAFSLLHKILLILWNIILCRLWGQQNSKEANSKEIPIK